VTAREEEAPSLVRVVARPFLVAREKPERGADAVAPIVEGAIVEVASRDPRGWLCLRLSGRAQTPPGSSWKSAWIPETSDERERSVLPLLPALFEVTAGGVEVKSEPWAESTTLGGLKLGELFDVILFDGDWLKVYHGREAQPGKWWTRRVGWVDAGSRERPFVHLRGLVPAVEGKDDGIRFVQFSSTPRSLYDKSKDGAIGQQLGVIGRSARPLDNQSEGVRRNLEEKKVGPPTGAVLGDLLRKEAAALTLRGLEASGSAGKGGENVEVVPSFRHRSKKHSERKVNVECAWYVSAHAAAVSFLQVDRHSGLLFSGCEKPNPEDADRGVTAKVWASDGSLQKSFRCPGATVRSMGRNEATKKDLICVSGEGKAFAFDFETAERTSVIDLGESEAEIGVGGAAELFPRPLETEEPKFVAESGFRGKRKGYVFRKGEYGIGYYREDVIFEVVTFPMSENVAYDDEETIRRVRRERRAKRDRLETLIKVSRSTRACALAKGAGRVYYGAPGKGDFQIKCYDLSEGRSLGSLAGHQSDVLSLAMGEGDRVLYSGSYDKVILEWDLETSELRGTLAGHTAGVHDLCVSGKFLYSCSSDNSIRAWDTSTRRCVKTFFGQHAPGTWPTSIAVSPDQRYLVSGSKGPFGATSIKLWSAHAHGGPQFGTCLCTFSQLDEAQPGSVSRVAFGTEDSTRVYTGATDGTIAAWAITESLERKKHALSGFLR